MSGYVLKPARQPITWVMDWRRGHLAPGERLTADLGWSLRPFCGEERDLVVVEQGHDVSTSWAVFAGGVEGRVYMVSNRVRTNDDRVLSRAVVMRIALG